MRKLAPLSCYAFAWQNDKANRLTVHAEITREHCRAEIVRVLGMPWADIYKRGGRVVKCTITPAK